MEEDADHRGEAARRGAAAPTDVERQRWRVIQLWLEGAAPATISAETGYRPRTVRAILQRYREGGADALADQRRRNPGGRPLLSPEQEAALRSALAGAAPGGGRWTGPTVAAWIAARTGRPVHRQRGWEYLRTLQAEGDDRG